MLASALCLERQLTICVCVCVCVYIYMYIYIYILLSVCVCVCVYIYIYCSVLIHFILSTTYHPSQNNSIHLLASVVNMPRKDYWRIPITSATSE